MTLQRRAGGGHGGHGGRGWRQLFMGWDFCADCVRQIAQRQGFHQFAASPQPSCPLQPPSHLNSGRSSGSSAQQRSMRAAQPGPAGKPEGRWWWWWGGGGLDSGSSRSSGRVSAPGAQGYTVAQAGMGSRPHLAARGAAAGRRGVAGWGAPPAPAARGPPGPAGRAPRRASAAATAPTSKCRTSTHLPAAHAVRGWSSSSSRTARIKPNARENEAESNPTRTNPCNLTNPSHSPPHPSPSPTYAPHLACDELRGAQHLWSSPGSHAGGGGGAGAQRGGPHHAHLAPAQAVARHLRGAVCFGGGEPAAAAAAVPR